MVDLSALQHSLSLQVAKRKLYQIIDIQAALPKAITIKEEHLVLVGPNGREVRRGYSEVALFMRKDQNCEACWLYDLNAANTLLQETGACLWFDANEGLWKVYNSWEPYAEWQFLQSNTNACIAIALFWLEWDKLQRTSTSTPPVGVKSKSHSMKGSEDE